MSQQGRQGGLALEKMWKVEQLSTSIISSGWSVHFFSTEVGTRGYCSTTVKAYLSGVGFKGHLLKSTIKKFTLSSLTTFFQIWLSRACKYIEDVSAGKDYA